MWNGRTILEYSGAERPSNLSFANRTIFLTLRLPVHCSLAPYYLRHFSLNSLGPVLSVVASRPSARPTFVPFPRVIYDDVSRGAMDLAVEKVRPSTSPERLDWFSECIFSWIPLPVVRYVSFRSFRLPRGDEEIGWGSQAIRDWVSKKEKRREEDGWGGKKGTTERE